MSNYEIATSLKEAFFEGYASFATPCNAYNTVEAAWEDSATKMLHDSLFEDED